LPCQNPNMHLKDMKVGAKARIVGYENENDDFFARLLALGLTKGAVITLKKIAPLGDPVELEVRGFNLSLRKAEADPLILEELS
jgi:ferrous iron transport protein A